MPIGDFLRRRPDALTCQACGSPLPPGAIFCPACGVKADDPQAEPLHIVDRTTGLFNDRFVRPVLEDELARHNWFTTPEEPKLVFDDDRDKLWDDAMARRTREL